MPSSIVAGRLIGSGRSRGRPPFGRLSYPCRSAEDVAMRAAFDFSPQFRSSVGFDHVLDLLSSAADPQAADNWPPYDIAKAGEDRYRITVAVAGFAPEELDIVVQPNLLVVSGQKRADGGTQYLYRGIAVGAFERRFQLADYVQVTGASLENGLLTVELAREVPEELRPRRIEVEAPEAAGTGGQPRRVEHQKAA